MLYQRFYTAEKLNSLASKGEALKITISQGTPTYIGIQSFPGVAFVFGEITTAENYNYLGSTGIIEIDTTASSIQQIVFRQASYEHYLKSSVEDSFYILVDIIGEGGSIEVKDNFSPKSTSTSSNQ